MSELLPCPFCGKLDAFVERADLSSSYVFCDECSARGPTECQESDDEEVPGEAAAIKAWNRRAQPNAEPVALRHLACIEDGELRMMTGYKIPPHDCELYAMPDGKAAPALYAHPPTDSAALRERPTAAEIEALRRDAARYQWLSNQATQQADARGPIFRIDVRRNMEDRTLFNVGAAIDAAIAQQEAP